MDRRETNSDYGQFKIDNDTLKSFVWYELDINVYNLENFNCGFSSKVASAYLLQETKKKLSELNILNI